MGAERRAEGRLSERDAAEQCDRQRLADDREPQDGLEPRLLKLVGELRPREQQAGVGVQCGERDRDDGADCVARRVDDTQSETERHRPDRPDGEREAGRTRGHGGRRDEQRYVDECEAGQEGDEEEFKTRGRLEYQLSDADKNHYSP